MPPFQPGNKMGGGRPKGARNRVSAKLIALYEAAFDNYGEKCLEIVARTEPATFLRLGYGTLVVRDLNIEVSAISEMPDDELEAMIERLRQQLLEEQRPPMIDLTPQKQEPDGAAIPDSRAADGAGQP
jgi:hypothetical protein